MQLFRDGAGSIRSGILRKKVVQSIITQRLKRPNREDNQAIKWEICPDRLTQHAACYPSLQLWLWRYEKALLQEQWRQENLTLRSGPRQQRWCSYWTGLHLWWLSSHNTWRQQWRQWRHVDSYLARGWKARRRAKKCFCGLWSIGVQIQERPLAGQKLLNDWKWSIVWFERRESLFVWKHLEGPKR